MNLWFKKVGIGVATFILLCSFQTSVAREQPRDYDDLLTSEVEDMSFSEWWHYLVQIASEEGEYIDSNDKDYFRINYYQEGYAPDDAFWEEYGDD